MTIPTPRSHCSRKASALSFLQDLLSWLILAGALAALAGWALVCKRRTRYTWPQAIGYLYSHVMSRVAWRAPPCPPLPVADNQGAVIVCNHIGPVDPAFIALATRRPVRWMVAREYYEMPLIGGFMRMMNAIPVNRGGIDTAATKTAIRSAQAGELVGLFPEGRINTTGQLLLPGRPGAALIALKSRVPVIPCYLRGSPRGATALSVLLMSARARLTVGRPMDLSAYYGRESEPGVLEEVTRKMLKEIARLAGRPDFEPQLAGKRWKPGQ